MKLKKRVVSLAVVVAMLAIAAVGTFAYFVDEGVAHNTITTGVIDIELKEQTQTAEGGLVDWPENGVTGVLPGMDVSKIVSVSNAENAGSAWVRVYVGWKIENADGAVMEDPQEGGKPALMMDFNSEAWTLDGDYWYYNEPLNPGEETEALFTTVTFNEGLGNEFQNCTATVTVEVEAVQTANNGGTAVEAAGWSTEAE